MISLVQLVFYALALDTLETDDETNHFSVLLQALTKRNTDLTPSQTEQTAITNLVNKIQAVLDGLIVSPGNFDACVSIASQHFQSLVRRYGLSGA